MYSKVNTIKQIIYNISFTPAQNEIAALAPFDINQFILLLQHGLLRVLTSKHRHLFHMQYTCFC